ncbi:MAG: transposase family protein [Bacilli bacterium]|nr:transposase family protein [Bacilli bacterium]
MFSELTDTRDQGYITYDMKTICVTRLFGLLCGLVTMIDISSDDFNTDNCIKNISKICGQELEELPYWETIQDVFIHIDIEELRNIQKYIVKALIRSKMLNKYLCIRHHQ